MMKLIFFTCALLCASYCPVFSEYSKITWKIAFEYLLNTREILVYNAKASIADELFSIYDSDKYPPLLIYSRNLAKPSQLMYPFKMENNTNSIKSEPIGYICPIEKKSDLTRVLDDIGQNFPRAYTVLCFDKFVEDPSATLRYAWQNYEMVNTILIQGNDDGANISVYNSFERVENHERGRVYNFPATNDNYTESLSAATITMRNRFVDMQAYPLNVSFFNLVFIAEKMTYENGSLMKNIGLNFAVLNIIIDKMNFLPILIEPADGKKYGWRNGSDIFTGSLGEIEYKHCALAANQRFMSDYATSNVAYTNIIKEMKLCYIVPRNYPSRPVIPIEPPISFGSKVIFGFIIVISCIVWYLLQWYHYWKRPFKSWDVVGRIFKILVGVSTKQPRTTPERYLFLSLTVLSLILVTVYQESITLKIATPGIEKDIETLQQLDNSGLIINMPNGLDNVDYSIESTENVYNKLLRKTRQYYGDIPDIVNDTFSKNRAACVPETYADYLENTIFSKENGINLIHKVQECPLSYYSAFYVQKNSPYVDRINKIISNAQSGGIFYKWSLDVRTKIKLARLRKTRRFVPPEHFQFIPFHYWKVFLLYGIGIAISTVIFIIEMTHDKFRRIIERT